MALGAIAANNPSLAEKYAAEIGRLTAQEALAVGINWLLAPVVDVNNNPHNPVINIRAFGDNPLTVGKLAAAFIKGASSQPILTTAKHFPGHGDTAVDSHLALPCLPHSDSRLERVELLPFREAIASGVDSVMSAHLLISAWDERYPATLSQTIVGDRLRQQLGFDGLVVTDALIMDGITKYAPPEEVAVMAIEAGSDILLMPDDPEVAIASIYNAVKSGRISEQRIEQSLARINHAKAKVVNNRDVIIDDEKLAQLSTVEAEFLVNAVLRDSLRSGGNLPLQRRPDIKSRNLIVVDDILNSAFLDLYTPAITIPQQFDYDRQIVDHSTIDSILADSRPTLLQIFIRGNPFRGNSGLTPQIKNIYRQLLQTGKVVGLIIYGSPYVLDWFSAVMPVNLPWMFCYGQMPTAQAISLETLFGLSPNEQFTTAGDRSNFGF